MTTSRQPHVPHIPFLSNKSQFSRLPRRMIPQLSGLKSHLRKNTSEPANKPPEALTSPCSPPGLLRHNATSTPRTSSKSQSPQFSPLPCARCKDRSCARQTSSRSWLPSSPPRRTVTPRASFTSPERLHDPLRQRRGPALRQPTRTKAEQAAYFQSLRDADFSTLGGPPLLTAANLAATAELASGHAPSSYTTYMFTMVPPEPARKRKPSLTQPTRKRAERVAAGDCMGRGCFSAFCATSCAVQPSSCHGHGGAIVPSTEILEPDTDPKAETFWTSIKQIRPIDLASCKSEDKRSLRRFIRDLIDYLKACGKLLLVAVDRTCILR